MIMERSIKKVLIVTIQRDFHKKFIVPGRKKRESIMKLSEFKIEVRKIVQERSISIYTKQQQKVHDGIVKL